MPNTPTTPASVASRLTDEEIERLSRISDEDYEWHKRNRVTSLAKNYKNVAAVLRDYVRLRNEIAQLKARLEAVVKECEAIQSHYEKVVLSQLPVTLVIEANRILRAARGEGGAE